MACCTGPLLERLSQFVGSFLQSDYLIPTLILEQQRYRVTVLVIFLFVAITSYRLLYLSNKRSLPYIGDPYPHFSEADIAEREKVLRIADLEAPLFQPPLRTKHRHIIDATGTKFKLASVNWYGASDQQFIPGGLDIRHRDEIATTIRRMGFNSVRLPYSDQMVRTNPKIPHALLTANPDLIGKRALTVFQAVVESLSKAGLGTVINNHITSARWCCDANVCDTMWSNSYLGPLCSESQTEDDWIDHWETIMRPHVDDPLVIGCDLRNEPRGLFGSVGWNMWAKAAERVSERLLAMQPNWLMVVEGTASSNDLSRVKSRPISLSVPNKLVYSAHVYGWSGWGSLDPYWGRDYASFAEDMRKNWAFIVEGDTAPVWVSEIGVPRHPTVGDMNYWDNLMRFMKETDVGFAYWAINPRKPENHEREEYSLVEDDWKTTIYDYRLCGLQKLMNDTSCDYGRLKERAISRYV